MSNKIEKNSTHQVLILSDLVMMTNVFFGIKMSTDMSQILNLANATISDKKTKLVEMGLLVSTNSLILTPRGRQIVAKGLAQMNYEVMVEILSV